MPQDSTQKSSSFSSPSSSSSYSQGSQTSAQKQGNPSTQTSADELVKAKDALLEGAQQLKTELKTAAGGAADQAKKAAETKLDAGRDFAAEHLGSVADALRKTGDELRATDSPLTDYIATAASSVDQVSFYLQTRTLSHVLGDLESFARREPAMFLGASFITGILGGRFLKSAAPASSKRGPSAGTPRPQSAPMRALPEYGSARTGNAPTPSVNPSYSPTANATGSSSEGTSTSPQNKTNGTRSGSDTMSSAGVPGAR